MNNFSTLLQKLVYHLVILSNWGLCVIDVKYWTLSDLKTVDNDKRVSSEFIDW